MGRRVSVVVKAVAVEKVHTTEADVDAYGGAGTIAVIVRMRARPRRGKRGSPIVVVAMRTLVVMMFATGTAVGITARTVVVVAVGTVVMVAVWTVVVVSAWTSVVVAFFRAVFVATVTVVMAAESRSGREEKCA